MGKPATKGASESHDLKSRLLHIFSRLGRSLASVAHFPALHWHRLHIFPRFTPVAHFPALHSGCKFPRVWPVPVAHFPALRRYRFHHIFARLDSLSLVAWFPESLPRFPFSCNWHWMCGFDFWSDWLIAIFVFDMIDQSELFWLCYHRNGKSTENPLSQRLFTFSKRLCFVVLIEYWAPSWNHFKRALETDRLTFEHDLLFQDQH